jgi:hypothetical protein
MTLDVTGLTITLDVKPGKGYLAGEPRRGPWTGLAELVVTPGR